MGKGAGRTETRKMKKKGRPSLLDIQKRLLKQQKLQECLPQTPNPSWRSDCRIPNSDWTDPESELLSGDYEDDDDERIRKKRMPMLDLNLQNRDILVNDNREGKKVLKVTDTGDVVHGSLGVLSGPTTPFPDKMLLVFILDRLQKKDIYGVFSEPVDPEELPDYHDIIKHPMDFGTVRKKLDGGAYANLEQFEKDIFLICSNAMQYNAPDTIFFRQARTIQEMAKKDFDNLRQDSDDGEPEKPKVAARRGRPPGSGKKKFSNKATADCGVGTEVSSDTVLANGDYSCFLNSYNLRRGPDPCIFQHANRENQNSWSSVFEKEFPASVLKSVSKEGKKLCPSVENRRQSYNQILVAQEQLVLRSFEAEPKYLTAVALHSEHGYARSLAQFGTNLGPVAQKVASKKLETVLSPFGTKSGRGLVGEDETSEQDQLLSGCSLHSDSELMRRLRSQTELMSPTSSVGDVTSEPVLRFQQKQIVPTAMPGSYNASEVHGVASNGYALNPPTSANYIQRFSENHWSWQVATMEQNAQCGSISCEPSNLRFPISGSPDPNLINSSQQLDLGLQLQL